RLRLRVDVSRSAVEVWFEGLFVRRFERRAGSAGGVALQMTQGDRLFRARSQAWTPHPLYVPLDISHLANDHFDKPIGRAAVQVRRAPFELPQGSDDHISLRKAGWAEAQRDPSSYYESYDGGPLVYQDPRMPFLRVPLADYAAAHLLASADADPGLTTAFTLQAGRYGFSGQVVQYDF